MPCICPKCGAGPDSYHQDYSSKGNVFLKNIAANSELDKMTIGEYAERNTRKLGGKVEQEKAEQKEAKSRAIEKLNTGLPAGRKLVDTTKLRKPFYRKGEAPLEIVRKDKKVLNFQRYIRDGVKVYSSDEKAKAQLNKVPPKRKK